MTRFVMVLGAGLATVTLGGACDAQTFLDGGRADATSSCDLDSDCDDDAFCNGVERCLDGLCAPGAPPCSDADCDEARGRCASCDVPDADADGHDSFACGGDDCDDEDAERYPGNAEVCDPGGRDEDCDDSTLGPDRDGDGYASTDCCNGEVCGRDCDDERSGVSPTAVDGCGGGDEDCDGAVDEASPPGTYYRDRDGDGYGDPEDSLNGCAPPEGYVDRAGDCNDDPSSDDPDRGFLAHLQNPGQAEGCDDEIDDDCDGSVDETAVTCWRDRDGDGYPVGGPVQQCACDGGWTANDPADVGVDCMDFDYGGFSGAADVHPGQEEYFTTGYCPSGCLCDDGRCHSLANACLAIGGCGAGNEDPSFDYDCNGRDTSYPRAGSTFSCETSCCGSYADYPEGSPPCGEQALIIDCGMGPCGACTGGGSSTRRLGCR